jgi:hypothetical protein
MMTSRRVKSKPVVVMFTGEGRVPNKREVALPKDKGFRTFKNKYVIKTQFA